MKHFHLYSLLLLLFVGCKMSTPISPGELAEAHAHLEGTGNCTECHTMGKRVSNNKCLDCHKDINQRIEQKSGYHASKEVTSEKCIKCHSDHHGKNFQIIKFDEEKFDHSLTGYKLEGAHAKNKCVDCHKKEFVIEEKVKEKKRKTFMGLGQGCLVCHDDFHQKTLADNCLECHVFDEFTSAKNFKHDQTEFTLIGKHIDVECVKCHALEKRNGKDFQVFSGVEFGNCTNCHKDQHDNKFGQDCKKCHTEESFHMIKGENDFDHSKTNFALQGKHLHVDCKTCHKGAYTNPLRHNYCKDCHADEHKGQLVKNGKSPDCKDCHRLDGFQTTYYTQDQHNKSIFPLKGAHIATPCLECHKKGKDWSFRNIGKSCVDCHDNIHKTYISEKYYPKQTCTSCHNENMWKAVAFDHTKTEFDLLGAHKNQSCRACHFKSSGGGNYNQQFSSLSTNCDQCHTDVHYKQFDKNDITDCARCHGFVNWQAGKFNHDNTAFKLDGKHINVSCAKCHKDVQNGSNTFTLYKIKDYRCEDCH